MKNFIPQITFICLYMLSIAISGLKHGYPREGNYNFFTTLLSSLIGIALLIWGGFFR